MVVAFVPFLNFAGKKSAPIFKSTNFQGYSIPVSQVISCRFWI